MLCGAAHPERARLERVVRRVYRMAHGAQVTHLHDRLLGLLDARGRPLAVIGTSAPAERERVFLERYLEGPVEAGVAGVLGRSVRRADLAEVGNLAGVSAGLGVWAMGVLARTLQAEGRPLAVCVATDALRRSFGRLGVTLHELRPADRGALGSEGDAWGRYYERDPRVVVLEVGAVIASTAVLDARPELLVPHGARGVA